jgi:hypothetical protein
MVGVRTRITLTRASWSWAIAQHAYDIWSEADSEW